MGRDDELSVFVLVKHVVEEHEKAQLALGGESGFGFIQEKQPISSKFEIEQCEEGLAMRACVQALAAIEGSDQWCVGRWFLIEAVHMGDSVEKTFGPKEVTCPCAPVEGQSQGTGQRVYRMITLRTVISKTSVSA